MRALLFDIDGTLIHSGGAGKEALRQALISEFGLSDPDVDINFGGRTDLSLATEISQRNQLDIELSDIQRFFAAYCLHLKRILPTRDGRVLPGVTKILPQLHAQSDVLLGLVTGNIYQGAMTKLAHFDLDHYFEFGGFGDDHLERGDIARAGLNEARNRGSVDSEDALIIGDTAADVYCARAAGIRCLIVQTGFDHHDSIVAAGPDYLVKDLTEPEALRVLGLS